MNWEAIGAIAEAAGAIVVVATLVYLALQVRHSTRVAIASTEIDVRNGLNLLNHSVFTDTGLAEIFVKATDPTAEFTDVESQKLYHLVVSCLNAWLCAETAHINGMVPPETFNVIEDDMRAFLTDYPASRPLWRKAIDSYPAQSPSAVFRSMNRVLEEYGN